jgi:Lar family restriction alleviation protein
MTEKLKPCPFCGSNAYMRDHRLSFSIACDACGATVVGIRAPEPTEEMPDEYWNEIKKTAIDKWNTRLVEETVKELQDTLRNGLRYDEETNTYQLVWTEDQIRGAEKTAQEILESTSFVEAKRDVQNT